MYSHAQLHPLLAPCSVAIIGASGRPGSFGERTLRNLRAHFAGPVHLVNPQYGRLGDDPCHPEVAALPEVPDCAVIAVPREKVEPLVAQCVAARVPGVLVFASGYAETDLDERLDQQRALAALVRGTSTRLLGPNCIGFANYVADVHLSFSAFPSCRPGPGAIGIASQSGALAMAIAQGASVGTPVSHALACGNMVDVDVADCVSYLAGEPACHAIVCVLEGHEHPARVEAAALAALAAGKPLVVHKLGRTPRGALAAWRHTASVAGSHDDWRALFERCGAIEVEQFDRVMEVAAFFAKAPRAGGRGAAVLSTSGGACIIAADAAGAHDVALPQAADPATGIDAVKVVHGEQRITLHAPLPASGEVIGRTRVTGLVDKGEGKGALLYSEKEITDAATGKLLATTGSTTFLRGDGGFGGPSGPVIPPNPMPEGAPEIIVDLPTRLEQAFYYRLNGDDNPLHIDPEIAAKAGFPRPILHGLCTLGVVTHALMRELGDYRPDALKKLSLRFSSPVYPGETIRTEIWKNGAFRARVVERDVVVVNNGHAEFAA